MEPYHLPPEWACFSEPEKLAHRLQVKNERLKRRVEQLEAAIESTRQAVEVISNRLAEAEAALRLADALADAVESVPLQTGEWVSRGAAVVDALAAYRVSGE